VSNFKRDLEATASSVQKIGTVFIHVTYVTVLLTNYSLVMAKTWVNIGLHKQFCKFIALLSLVCPNWLVLISSWISLNIPGTFWNHSSSTPQTKVPNGQVKGHIKSWGCIIGTGQICRIPIMFGLKLWSMPKCFDVSTIWNFHMGIEHSPSIVTPKKMDKYFQDCTHDVFLIFSKFPTCPISFFGGCYNVHETSQPVLQSRRPISEVPRSCRT